MSAPDRGAAVALPVSRWAGAGLRHVDEVVGAVRAAAADGFAGVWLPQTFSVDALTALAVAAREVPGIPIGTAVVPIQGRHPVPLAQQALTVAQAAGSMAATASAGPDATPVPGHGHGPSGSARFTLGIGVTHPPVAEGVFGVPYRRAASMSEEFLTALRTLLPAPHTAHSTAGGSRHVPRSASTRRRSACWSPRSGRGWWRSPAGSRTARSPG